MHITDEYFRYAVHQITLGRRHQMPDIRACADCQQFYRNDYTGLAWCSDCRSRHDRICIHCGTHFTGKPDGIRLCKSCRNQESLF